MDLDDFDGDGCLGSLLMATGLYFVFKAIWWVISFTFRHIIGILVLAGLIYLFLHLVH